MRQLYIWACDEHVYVYEYCYTYTYSYNENGHVYE